jgi:hypothetical protein
LARSEQTNPAGEAVGVTFALAVILNSVEVFVDPDGWLWTGTRAAVSVLFGLAVVWWIVEFARRRRTGTAARP